jgi:hypothetical protein
MPDTIATVEGVVYIRAIAVETENIPLFYCYANDWPTSPAGKLASRDARIAELEELNAELRSAAALVPELEAQIIMLSRENDSLANRCIDLANGGEYVALREVRHGQ